MLGNRFRFRSMDPLSTLAVKQLVGSPTQIGPSRPMFELFLTIECVVQHTMTSPRLFGALRDTRGERHVQTLVWATQIETLVSARKFEGRVLDASRLRGAVRYALWGKGAWKQQWRTKNRNTRRGMTDTSIRAQRILPRVCLALYGTHAG